MCPCLGIGHGPRIVKTTSFFGVVGIGHFSRSRPKASTAIGGLPPFFSLDTFSLCVASMGLSFSMDKGSGSGGNTSFITSSFNLWAGNILKTELVVCATHIEKSVRGKLYAIHRPMRCRLLVCANCQCCLALESTRVKFSLRRMCHLKYSIGCI